MATTPEAKVKAKVKVILKELFAYYTMPVTGGFGTSGAPDFLVCLNGHFVGIECKAGKGKPTALQEKNLNDIKRAGGEALVINEDNVANLRELLIWRTR
tara:strand:- start:238 stop:534 length:297 start_codon:yes stop_codon:yes gene_type:complete